MEHLKIIEIVKENISEYDLKIISFLKENYNRSIDIQTLWIIKQLLKRNKTSKKKAKNILKTLFHNFQAQEIQMEETKIHKEGKATQKHPKKETRKTRKINNKNAIHNGNMNATCDQPHAKDQNKK